MSSCLFCLLVCLFWRVCPAKPVYVAELWWWTHFCCVTSFNFYLRVNKSTPQAVFTLARNTCQCALWLPAYFKTRCSNVCFNVCRVCPKRDGYADESQQQFSASAPPASLSLLGNFEVQQAIAVMPSVQAAPEPRMAAVGAHLLFGHCWIWLKRHQIWLETLISDVWLNLKL